jgi:Zn-dependent protease/predicted transcriptional regulator
MEANLKLGRIWGIPIGLHLSWFLIFILITWSLSTGYFPQEYPQLSEPVHILLGVVTSLLFFGSVLGHELGHAFIALRNKIPVNGITLFIFGGVAQIAQEPKSPGAEFRIAIAGPAVSLGLSLLFGGLYLLVKDVPVLAAPGVYLMRINLMLALFNLIPGFPLDGGRVLRAIVWKITNSFQKATQAASFSGQLVAFGFIGSGIFTIFTGNLMNGLWLAFIGWFLQNAAASTYAQTNLQNQLRGIRVGQVMARDFIRIPSLTPLSTLVNERVLTGGQRNFFVADNGRLLGMITLRDIAEIPQTKWGFITSQQAMVPFEKLVRVTPETELLAALQIMDTADVAQVPVVKDEEIVGLLSREQVVHYLRTRAELGI